MEIDRRVNLVEPTGFLSKRRTAMQLTDFRRLDVGGCGGSKYKVKGQVLGQENPSLVSLVIKEHSWLEWFNLLGVVEAYNILRQRDYPVPSTTGYFITGLKPYLLMSDVTQEGRCLIWGKGKEPTEAQVADLQAMKLTRRDFEQVKEMGSELMMRANANGFVFSVDWYLLMRDKRNRDLSMSLLDVNLRGLTTYDLTQKAITQKNERHWQWFLKDLSYHHGNLSI
jgi:hypothetical protein